MVPKSGYSVDPLGGNIEGGGLSSRILSTSISPL